MSTDAPRMPEGMPVPAAVYLLRRHDGLRFKIGWAREPLSRVLRLPEFEADELTWWALKWPGCPASSGRSRSSARCTVAWPPSR